VCSLHCALDVCPLCRQGGWGPTHCAVCWAICLQVLCLPGLGSPQARSSQQALVQMIKGHCSFRVDGAAAGLRGYPQHCTFTDAFTWQQEVLF
jgi:hypothetical protein